MGNLQILQGAYADFMSGDVPSVLAVLDPKIEWAEAEGHPYKPDGKPWVGGDAVVEHLFQRLATEWDGFAVTTGQFYDAGDTIVVEVRYTGVYKATGKRLDSQACHIWKFRDGKITSLQQYLDTGQMQDAMGTLDAERPTEASVA